jgi:hypothetical protein
MAPFTLIDAPMVQVPLALRAPLCIDHAPRVFGSLAVYERGHLVELVVSPFSPGTWGDLWRIELDVINSTGVLAEIALLLAAHGINILSAEASVFGLGEGGTISLIVDLTNYVSSNDSSSRHRSHSPRVQLPDLQARIVATFIQDLVFADMHGPRIRIRRIHAHYHLFHAVVNEGVSRPEEIPVANGCLRLGRTCMDIIRKNVGRNDGGIRAMLLADSEDRVMRVLFAAEGGQILHVRVFFRPGNGTFAEILRQISKASFDIVRCLQQPGLPADQVELETASPADYATLDLTLRNTIDDPDMDQERLVNLIRIHLTGARELAHSSLFVASVPLVAPASGQV